MFYAVNDVSVMQQKLSGAADGTLCTDISNRAQIVHRGDTLTESEKVGLFDVLLEILKEHKIDVDAKIKKHTREDSNLQPSVPKTDALSN